jgi:hypothetical protein
MGFGILFLGYFATTMMSIPLSRMLPIDLGGFVKLFGYILIIIAAKRLSEYSNGFAALVVSSLLPMLISAFEAVVDVSLFLTDNQIVTLPFSEAITFIKDSMIVDYASFIAVIFFVSTLCIAIKQIAQDTGIKKIEIAATRNFVFYCILFAVQALSFMPFDWVTVYRPVFVSALLIIELLCWILNLYMIFSCYAKICDSGDTEMKQKPSRFEFVNKKREEQEAERQKILDEYAEKTNKSSKKRKK